MKRALDLVASLAGLVAGSVVLVPVMIAVWLQDRHSPFYIAPRGTGRRDVPHGEAALDANPGGHQWRDEYGG
jgi:hypothetical protein